MEERRVIQSESNAERVSESLGALQRLPDVVQRAVAVTKHPLNVGHICQAEHTELRAESGQLQRLIGWFIRRHRFLKVTSGAIDFPEMKKSATHREVRAGGDDRIVPILGNLEKS